LELSCETDFVSKNEGFGALAYDLAMQVVATNPQYLKTEDISEEDKEKVKTVLLPELEGKPEAMKEKILAGKMDAYFADKVLLEQPFIKNGDVKIKDLIQDAIQKFGEKTEIRRFVRYSVLDK
jgi:elongation factor Ts